MEAPLKRIYVFRSATWASFLTYQRTLNRSIQIISRVLAVVLLACLVCFYIALTLAQIFILWCHTLISSYRCIISSCRDLILWCHTFISLCRCIATLCEALKYTLLTGSSFLEKAGIKLQNEDLRENA